MRGLLPCAELDFFDARKDNMKSPKFAHRLRSVSALLMLLVFSFLFLGTTASLVAQVDADESEFPWDAGFEGPAEEQPNLVQGSLDFHVVVSGYPAIDFSSPTESIGTTESLVAVSTPFGPAYLWRVTSTPGIQYTLDVPSLGLLMPMSWVAGDSTYEGPQGPVQVQVKQGPIKGEGGAAGVEIARRGKGIIIKAPAGNYVFVQFFTVKMTWSGTDIAGASVTDEVDPGPCKPSGNDGNSINTDGTYTYVDSTTTRTAGANPVGNYPITGTTQAGNAVMVDAPDVVNPNRLADQAAAHHPGSTVMLLKLEYHFTTYVLRMPGRQVVAKIEWSYYEEIAIPAAPGLHIGGGVYGGPNIGPQLPGADFPFSTPTVTATNTMDAEHTMALLDYNSAPRIYDGAVNSGW